MCSTKLYVIYRGGLSIADLWEGFTKFVDAPYAKLGVLVHQCLMNPVWINLAGSALGGQVLYSLKSSSERVRTIQDGHLKQWRDV